MLIRFSFNLNLISKIISELLLLKKRKHKCKHQREHESEQFFPFCFNDYTIRSKSFPIINQNVRKTNLITKSIA